MLRQSDIAAAFCESILRSSNGFQYLHTRDVSLDIVTTMHITSVPTRQTCS